MKGEEIHPQSNHVIFRETANATVSMLNMLHLEKDQTTMACLKAFCL